MPVGNVLSAWLVINIIVVILLTLLFICFVFLLIDIIIVLRYISKIRKNDSALCVLYTAKLDIYSGICEILIKDGYEIDQNLIKTLNYIDTEDFANQNSSVCDESKDKLTSVGDIILLIVTSNDKYRNDLVISGYLNSIAEYDANIKNAEMLYNVDIQGYNYWINIPPFKFIHKIFKQKEKKTI